MHQLKYVEWQSPSGCWFCNDTKDIGTSMASEWWAPARMMNMEPADYVKWVVDNYKPDKITFENKFLFFCWTKEHYSLCHKMVLDINRYSRKVNFVC